MKYFIIAGERSGDLHASNLVKSIIKIDPEAHFKGIGGGYMQEAGVNLLVDYSHLAVMGFAEVLTKIRMFKRQLKRTKEEIVNYKPDVVILVDFAGFNLRIAKFIHQIGIKAIYYISPKIWAWNYKRVKKIKAYIDKMLVILPFEKKFYGGFGYEVFYVGNPLVEFIKEFKHDNSFEERHNIQDKEIIAILPGSRKQEIEMILSTMLKVSQQFPDYHFVIAGVSNLPLSIYDVAREKFTVIMDETYDLLSVAKAAIVTSGTATLETALFNVPQVVCYKTSRLTYLIGKLLIKVRYISLVNLIANKVVVSELIQSDFNQENLGDELYSILPAGGRREEMLENYKEVRDLIGEMSASKDAASLIVDYIRQPLTY